METNEQYTVWEFRGLSGEKVKAVRLAVYDDMQRQSEYQRVLWRGWASSRAEALAKV